MDADRFEWLIERLRSGGPDETGEACDELTRGWRDAPVAALLSLKEQFGRMGLEHREASVEEALVSIAEKRPGPFTELATQPEHPLWEAAVEVLSLVGDDDYLELFIALLPLCPRKGRAALVRAIGCYRCARAEEALASELGFDEEASFMEAVVALRRMGTGSALARLRDALEDRRRRGSSLAEVLEAAVGEMAAGPRAA